MSGLDLILPAPVASLPWTPGQYYDFRAVEGGEPATTSALAANVVYAIPFEVPQAASIDRIACNVTTGAVAGKLLRLGIAASLSTGLPGATLLDSGTLAADAIAVVEATVALTLPAGWYYGLITSDGAPTVTAYAATRSPSLLGWSSASSTTVNTIATLTRTFAALPATFGTPTALGNTMYRVAVRAA